MRDYQLQTNEVVFYKGDVTLKEKKGATELIFTNLNIVFITRLKKFLKDEEITVEIFPITDIKVYNNQPQIKYKGNLVEIYFLNTEKEIVFCSKIELHKFINSTTNFFTGKTKVERGAEKIKNAIGLVNDTLGVDSVNMVGNVVKDGVIGKVTGVVGKLFKKKK